VIGTRDLHLLPRTRDSLSFLYVEHASIEQEHRSIVALDAAGRVPIPCASLSLLMLGPGTTITHAAVRTMAATGCLVAWSGEQGVRFYAAGTGETRSARNAERQARAWADPRSRLRVVRAMYETRFAEPLAPNLTIQQIRGLEGIRVRDTYAALSRLTGIRWNGRAYRRGAWGAADPINRALSSANSALYGVVHAAIVASGHLTSLGFIHSGRQLSFVYDIADLYKTETSFPAAFLTIADGADDLEGRVRRRCRDLFYEVRLLERLVPDIVRVISASGEPSDLAAAEAEDELDLPGPLWDPEVGAVDGGVDHDDGPL
jgi:CRISPR-associated protein Cas1